MAVQIELDVTDRACPASEIRSCTVYPFLSVDSFGIVPCIFAFPDIIIEIDAKIKQKHLVVRNLREKSLDAFRIPDMSLVSEHPSLKYPCCLRIGTRDGIVKMLSVRGDLVETLLSTLFGKRHLHLVETVGQIVLTLAELLLPLCYIFLCNQLELLSLRADELGNIERSVLPSRVYEFQVRIDPLYSLRNKTGEGIVDRCHSQFIHTVYELVLKFDGLVVVGLRKVSVKFCHISHTEPREMGRSSHKFSDLLFGKAEFSPHPCINRFASDRRKRHVDAMKCHPVEFLFPSLEFPVRRSVAHCTHIHILSVDERRDYGLEFLVRKTTWKVDIVDCPCHHSVMVCLYIVIKATAGSHCRTGLYGKSAAFDLCRIVFGRVVQRTGHLDDDITRVITQRPLQDPPGSLLRFREILLAACRQSQHCGSKKQNFKYFSHYY